jgi:hypothetical protein
MASAGETVESAAEGACVVFFIGTHNETLSVIAMRVNCEDCSPARIHDRRRTPTKNNASWVAALKHKLSTGYWDWYLVWITTRPGIVR